MTPKPSPSADRRRFRTWHKDTEQFLTIEMIDFNNGGEASIRCKEELGVTTPYDADKPNDPCYGCPVSDVAFTQSTGLLDKNGKEIYEGDIVEGNGDRAQVVWLADEDSCGWWFRGIDGHSEWQWINHHEMMTRHGLPKVIGNIYENPDLLLAS